MQKTGLSFADTEKPLTFVVLLGNSLIFTFKKKKKQFSK